MKRIVLLLGVVLGLTWSGTFAHASWGQLTYSGYQPWWNIFAKRYKCLSPEEERLQKFWHDYYNAMKCYYGALDSIDWVAYYKNHGVPVAGCGGCGSCGRINYMPVFVSPQIQFALPQTSMGGPPPCPPYAMPGPGPVAPASYPPYPMPGPGPYGPPYGPG